MTNIHYFYDPMCGWCYGASSLIEAIEENSDLNLIFHPGGMIEKCALSEHFKQHILAADPRIATLTGVKFGENYTTRLKSSDEFIVDSMQTTKAILSAQQLGVSSYKMLKAIQQAHYVQGLEVYKLEELHKLIQQFDIDDSKWLELMNSEETERLLDETINQSHLLMRELHVSGYPTLIAEREDSLMKLPHEQHYSRINDWKSYLTSI